MDPWVVQTEERKARIFSDHLTILQTLAQVAMADEQKARTLLAKLYAILHTVITLSNVQKEKENSLKELLEAQKAEVKAVMQDITNHFEKAKTFNVEDARHHLEHAADISARILKPKEEKKTTTFYRKFKEAA